MGPDEEATVTDRVAELIRTRRTSRLDGLSARQAATRAAVLVGGSFSEMTWRNVEAGKTTKLRWIFAAASVLGITPEEMEQAGRPDVAEVLRKESGRRTTGESGPVHTESVDANAAELLSALQEADVTRIALRSAGLSPMSRKAILQIVEAALIAEGAAPTDTPNSGES
ncbi:hypothetical protein ACWEN6_13825 [Sphaerisporangium sp. NPDC004334]